MMRRLLVFILFSLGINLGFTQPIKAVVDPRVELLTIAFRLAGAQEFSPDSHKAYVQKINEYFVAYQDHPLIDHIKKIRYEQGIGYDAVSSMAVHLTYPELTPIVPFTEKVPEPRWGTNPKNTQQFLSLLKDFAQETNFDQFFTSQKQRYHWAEKQFNENIIKHIDLYWYERFYGKSPNEEFKVILGMGFTGNFGIKLQQPNTKDWVYSILGAWDFNEEGYPIYTSENGYIETIIHEFNHSFINYIQDAMQADLQPYGPSIFDLVKKDMKNQAYSNWLTGLNEGLVRAGVVMYFTNSDFRNPSLKNQQLLFEVYQKKFYWVVELAQALEFYNENRNLYPSLEHFMPEIIKVYKKISQNPLEYYQKAMDRVFSLKMNYQENPLKIISFYPENHQTNVSESTSEIRIRFSQPIQKKLKIQFAPFPYVAPPLSGVTLSEDKTTLHISFGQQLDRNTHYGLVFHYDFISEDGSKLDKAYLYHFTTQYADKTNTTYQQTNKHHRFTFDPKINRKIYSDTNLKKITLEEYLAGNTIKTVHLIGDFNQWDIQKGIMLKPDNHTSYQIELALAEIEPNSEFTFVINEEYYLVPNSSDSNARALPNTHHFIVKL